MLWPTVVLLFIMAGSNGLMTPHCDMVEINHLCHADGSEKFTQVIAWEWMPRYSVYRAQDWRMTDGWSQVGKQLNFRYQGKSWSIRFQIIRETWTEDDPELKDREFFPLCERVMVFR